MEPSHFLCLARPPRPTFMQDMTPDERAIMAQHALWLKDLLARGKLQLAGPCLDGVYGVAIFKVSSIEEMRSLLETDPAVIGKVFSVERTELHPMLVGLIAS